MYDNVGRNLPMPRKYNFQPVIQDGDTDNYFNGDSFQHLLDVNRENDRQDNRTGGKKMKRTTKKNKRKYKINSIKRGKSRKM